MTVQPARIFAGWDPREPGGYGTFAHSVSVRSSVPVSVQPVALGHLGGWERRNPDDKPGSTEFAFSRFLVPYLCDYEGWALWADGADMLCLADIAELWALRDARYAAMCVQHEPYVVHEVKMWDQANEQYPRKNWSSLVLWNCGHPANRELTPDCVADEPGSFLHQFRWLQDSELGALPARWNVLVGTQPSEDAAILHFTDGLPFVFEYARGGAAERWLTEFKAATFVKRGST